MGHSLIWVSVVWLTVCHHFYVEQYEWCLYFLLNNNVSALGMTILSNFFSRVVYSWSLHRSSGIHNQHKLQMEVRFSDFFTYDRRWSGCLDWFLLNLVTVHMFISITVLIYLIFNLIRLQPLYFFVGILYKFVCILQR